MKRNTKKIIAILMVIATITSISVYASETNIFVADDEGLITPGELIYENEAVTNEDMKTHFENYADDGATVNLPNTITEGENGVANVVGVVKDTETGSVISGATVSVDGMITVTTDSDGRFQIKNLPAGTYDWIVNADGYATAEYLNYESYDISSGATIFSFAISKNHPIHDDWLNTTAYDEHIAPDFPTTNVSVNPTSFSTTPSAKRIVPIWEYRLVNEDRPVSDLNREEYIAGVVLAELSGVPGLVSNGSLTQTQAWQLYVAQAIAANSFLEYHLNNHYNHGQAVLCDGHNPDGCCQRYNGVVTNELVLNAISAVFLKVNNKDSTVILFYKPTANTYDYMYAAFSACCNNAGTRTHPSHPELVGKQCTDLMVTTVGHRYGLCQMGAAQRAKNGEIAMDILKYYYTNVTNLFCPLY